MDECLTVPAEHVGGDVHWIQVHCSTLSRKSEATYRTRTQKNGDLKVYRTA